MLKKKKEVLGFWKMKVIKFSDCDFWSSLKESVKPVSLDADVQEIVRNILRNVHLRGDESLFEYARRFDKVVLSTQSVRVTEKEMSDALKSISKEDIKNIEDAIRGVEFFNKKTLPKNWRAKNIHGGTVGENFYPINRVGIYVPGGQVPLVSTVVMTVTLAKIAKCPEICVCTPCRQDGRINSHLLSALGLCGVEEIYKVGGAQAIGAMAYGTKSVKAVDKIFGPGNAFVIEAKRQVYGTVGCDLLPGPSEVLIIADKSANAKYIAADLLSQAEHGSGKEKIFFVTTDEKLIVKVQSELKQQSESLMHKEKLMKIIDTACLVVKVSSLAEAVEVSNYISAEHTELHVQKAVEEKMVNEIRTSGAILIGESTPTVLGDFVAGPSHTLPTGRTGRFSSGLQVIDFMRRSSIVKYDEKSIKKAGKVVSSFAGMESLDAHGRSLTIRFK